MTHRCDKSFGEYITMKMNPLSLPLGLITLFTLIILCINLFEKNVRLNNQIEDMLWEQRIMSGSGRNDERVRFTTGLNETGLPFDVVPNIVHYILFRVHEIEFAHFVSMLSVLKNQRPELIYIHCDCHQLNGDNYKRVLRIASETNTSIIVRYIERPNEILGYNLTEKWVSTRVT